MDYYEYWGLSAPPFSLSPDPDKLYMSRQHNECLLRLRYAIESHKGGALLVSENAGDGKTSLLKHLAREIQQETGGTARIAFITHPTLTARELIGEIARQLGIDHSYNSKIRTLNELDGHLRQLHRDGSQALVIVDEGQMLADRPDILQELRILLNLCVADSFLLTFILSGQKPLEKAVRSMPEFWQRLPVRFFLGNLDFDDTRKLIRHRLSLAGLAPDREIFSDDAYREIFQASNGCPRVICSIADLSLVIGRSLRIRQLEASEIAQARADMEKSAAANSFSYYYFLRSEGRSRRASAEHGKVGSPETSRPPKRTPSPVTYMNAEDEAAFETSSAAADDGLSLAHVAVFMEGRPANQLECDHLRRTGRPLPHGLIARLLEENLPAPLDDDTPLTLAVDHGPQAGSPIALRTRMIDEGRTRGLDFDDSDRFFARSRRISGSDFGKGTIIAIVSRCSAAKTADAPQAAQSIRRTDTEDAVLALAQRFTGPVLDAAQRRLRLVGAERALLCIPRRCGLFARSLSVDILSSYGKRNAPCSVVVTSRGVRFLTPHEVLEADFDDIHSVRSTRSADGATFILLQVGDDLVYRIRLNNLRHAAPYVVDFVVGYVRAMQPRAEPERIPVEV